MTDKTSNQAAADPTTGVVIAAVEARTGRLMTPEEAVSLVDDVWRLRQAAQTVHAWGETARRCRQRLAKARADKAVLERAMKLIRFNELIEPDSRQSALVVLEGQLNMFNKVIDAGEGKSFTEILGEGGGTRRKQALETLVLYGLLYWFDATGDNESTIRVGHPDRPGPFLRFLEAISAGVPGGITRNSLYDKTRQVVGRRR